MKYELDLQLVDGSDGGGRTVESELVPRIGEEVFYNLHASGLKKCIVENVKHLIREPSETPYMINSPIVYIR